MGYKAEIRELRGIVDQQSRKLGALYSLFKQVVKVKGRKTKTGATLRIQAFDLIDNDKYVLETEEDGDEIIIRLKEVEHG